MGQKSNPTSLRLEKSNKHFTSCWYSDLSYTLSLGKDLRANIYLQAVFEQFQYPAPLLLTQSLYKGWRGYLLFLNPFRSRNEKSRFFHLERLQMPRVHQISLQEGAFQEKGSLAIPQFSSLLGEFFTASPLHSSNTEDVSQNSSFLPKTDLQEREERTFLRERKEKELRSLLLNSSLQRIRNQRVLLLAETFKRDTLSLFSFALRQGWGVSSPSRTEPLQEEMRGSRGEGVSNLETVLRFSELAQPLQNKGGARSREDVQKGSRIRGYSVELQTIRAIWEGQNADLLAEEILHYLGKRIPFRRIKYQIVREMERDPAIKGVRIHCSGRLGGRSKKAQKAKTESIQWGQTSLHVFSSKLSYSSKEGVTSFGKIGVKVWICYI